MSKHRFGIKANRVLSVPIMGNADHNSGFLIAIGGLVVNWANNESVFMALMQSLVSGGTHTATIIWHSLRTTQARMDLISKLAREQIRDEVLLKDLDKAIRDFKGLTGKRNFFCHSTYHYDKDLCLASVQGITLSQEGDPLRTDERRMDAAIANEIGTAIVELAKLNRRTWKLVARVENALGVQRVKFPPLPPEDLPT